MGENEKTDDPKLDPENPPSKKVKEADRKSNQHFQKGTEVKK